MAEQWYYQSFGQDFGPISLDELAQKLNEGELAGEDLVREGSRGAWKAADGTKVLTDRAAEMALETAEVATDIDSFMLGDEQGGSIDVVPDINSFQLEDEHSAPDEVATDINSFLLADEKAESKATSGKGVVTERAAAKDSRGIWFYQSLGLEFGPVPFSELLEKAAQGELGPEDSVRKGETGQWVPAGLIENLFPDDSDSNDEDEESDDDFAVAADVLPNVQNRSAPSSRQPASRPANRVPPGAQRFQSSDQDDSDDEYETVEPQQYAGSGQYSADMGWYCYVNEQEIGPVGIADLQGYAASGQITPEVYVKYGAAGEWIQAAQVPQLYAPSAAPLATPPVQQPAVPNPATVPALVATHAATPTAVSLADEQRMELAHQLLALLKREINPGDLLGVGAPPSAGGWYCNISGSIMGPVTIDTLVQMVLQKRIFAEDMIRLGVNGEWFPAKTVPELFPHEAGVGKKKGGDDAGSVLSKIDKMYKDAQEAKEKQDAANKAAGITEQDTKPAPKAATTAPGDVLRNLNSSIARAATLSPEERKKLAAANASSGGGDGTMAEQLDDLLAKVGLRGKGLYILVFLAIVGVGAYFSPGLMGNWVAGSAYDGMIVIHDQLIKAHSSEAEATKWKAQSKKALAQLKELMTKVKGGVGASPKRDVAKMGLYLREMAETVESKPPPGEGEDQDPFLIVANRFKEAQKKAATKLGRSKGAAAAKSKKK